MRVSLEHLSSKFDKNLLNEAGLFKPEVLTEIVERLTLSGIELEKIIPAIEEDNYSDILEFKITPNRGDCLSLKGLVREIELLTDYVAISDREIFENKQSTLPSKPDLAINIAQTQACFNYCSLAIYNIDNTRVLPPLILNRLKSAGFNSVLPVVDILNYVMLETGQPLHGYKLSSLSGGIKIRLAYPKEQLLVLNNSSVSLDNDTLVIANIHDEVVAIAGVMGGITSAVELNTRDICLESCYFEPDIVMGKAKQYGLKSDAAYRFERGVASSLAKPAILYARDLIHKYLGGEMQKLQLVNPYMAKETNIKSSYTYIDKFIGHLISRGQIKDILVKLGCQLISQDEDGFEVCVPSHRFDLKIAEDLVEEIIRVYGYNNIQPVFPSGMSSFITDNPLHTMLKSSKDKLVSLGYNEVINYAFVEANLEAQFGMLKHKSITLKNPIANWSTMRSSLIGGLVNTLSANVKRGVRSAQLFEVANVFYGEDANLQPLKIAGLIYHSRQGSSWFGENQKVDFYDIKHDVEILLGALELNFIDLANYPVFHPSRCAKIVANGLELGVVGQLHPRIVTNLGLIEAPYIFEIDIASLSAQKQTPIYKKISRYPKVERDLSFILDVDTKASELLLLIKSEQAKIKYLIKIDIFDIYFDKIKNETSVAIKLIFQGDKTLQEDEIRSSLNLVIDLIFKHFNAKLKT